MKSFKQTREILKNIKSLVKSIRTPILFGKGFTIDEEQPDDIIITNHIVLSSDNEFCNLVWIEPTNNPLPELISSLDNKPLEYIVKAVIWLTQPRYIKVRIKVKYNELKWRFYGIIKK